jgi:hypothetical protein
LHLCAIDDKAGIGGGRNASVLNNIAVAMTAWILPLRWFAVRFVRDCPSTRPTRECECQLRPFNPAARKLNAPLAMRPNNRAMQMEEREKGTNKTEQEYNLAMLHLPTERMRGYTRGSKNSGVFRDDKNSNTRRAFH